MSGDSWVPENVSMERPSVARLYDYFLGGNHNFEVDRIAAERLLQADPTMRVKARANRYFLRRVVRFLAQQGISQFLDIGSGIPTVGNVHEVAQGINPVARIVYVDNDPIAVAHSEALLADNPQVTALQADARQPQQILEHPEVRRVLDFQQPTGILLAAMLHFVTDDVEVYRLVQTIQEAIVPGSFIVISHGTSDNLPRESLEQGQQVYNRSTNPFRVRSYLEIKEFFKGLELVEPGLVWLPQWRPEEEDDLLLDQPDQSQVYAGVGRKP